MSAVFQRDQIEKYDILAKGNESSSSCDSKSRGSGNYSSLDESKREDDGWWTLKIKQKQIVHNNKQRKRPMLVIYT